MKTILYERSKNGTPEEIEKWFQKACELYKAEGIPGRNDPRRNTFPTPWSATNTYIECCIEFGRYLDAMEAIEKYGGNDAKNETWSMESVRLGEYFDKLLELNAKTNYRYNSKELVERQIKFYQRITADGPISQNHTGGQQSRYITFIAAQLNLGLVDDAWESFRKLTDDRKSFTHWGLIVGFPNVILTSLGEIVFYAHKHKTPEEASRIEAAGFELFSNIDDVQKRGGLDSYLVKYYDDLAMRFKKDGDTEMGERYMAKARNKADEQQKQQEEPEQRVNSRSEMERFCVNLMLRGELDEATEIADSLGLPDVFLYLAEQRETAGETEKAKAAMHKALEAIPSDEVFRPFWIGGTPYSRLAMLAVKFDDKELFYDIMNNKAKIADKETWHDGNCSYPCREALSDFTRQLAIYGDKGHPLFARVEKYADGFQDNGIKAKLYFSLGVSFAMIDDHVVARRLLKKGIESRQKEQFKSNLSTFCAPVLEARSYEKR